MTSRKNAFTDRMNRDRKNDNTRLSSIEDALITKQDSKPIPTQDEKLLHLTPDYFYVEDQVRKTIADDEIEDRAASMRQNGQILPIVVYPKNEQGKYKIDKGECRWRAAQLIDGFKLFALVDDKALGRSKADRIVGQIVENEQRLNLEPFELAVAISTLQEEEGLTANDIAERIGWLTSNGSPNKNKISRILSILKLPDDGIVLVKDKIIVDLVTIENLRKISEQFESEYKKLILKAKEDNGLQRKFVEQVYKDLKQPNVEQDKTMDAQLDSDEDDSPRKTISQFENKKGVLQFKRVTKPNGMTSFELGDVSKAKTQKIFKFIQETLGAKIEV